MNIPFFPVAPSQSGIGLSNPVCKSTLRAALVSPAVVGRDYLKS